MRKNRLHPLAVLTISLACTSFLAGCPRQGEGPAERVGKTMDKGVGAVGTGVKKTGQAIEGAASGN